MMRQGRRLEIRIRTVVRQVTVSNVPWKRHVRSWTAVLALSRGLADASSSLPSPSHPPNGGSGGTTSSLRFPQCRHDYHSITSVPTAPEPLMTLREVQTRILRDKEYSPILSSHRRGPSTNISTLESKATVSLAGTFGRQYRKLPPMTTTDICSRRLVLEFLACECSVNREAIDKAVQAYDKVQQKDLVTPPLATYNRLHDVSAPIYDEILRYLLLDHAADGMESIVQIRQDLRRWIRSLQAKDTETVNLMEHLKLLEEHLQGILSVWFVPGLLEHRRITYENTAASILEHIVRNEAVHPVSSLRDLRRRLGSDRRVFSIFHPLLKDQPLFVLYVALLPSIPSSMTIIQKADESIQDKEPVNPPTVACFYSISNLHKGLVGVGMGEYLIHKTVERLQSELPSLQTFCTLSPIPGFRQWLESDGAHHHDWISDGDRQVLAKELHCTPQQSVPTLLERLQNLDELDALTSLPGIRQVMLRWTAHYLFHEKHRRKPLDRVARFHISNGAIMDQLHWTADLSPKGWRNSFGVMVTYRYDLMQLDLNQINFESNHLIPLGDEFSKHVSTQKS